MKVISIVNFVIEDNCYIHIVNYFESFNLKNKIKFFKYLPAKIGLL
jgi:hypothetical protein